MREIFGDYHHRLDSDEIEMEVPEKVFQEFYSAYVGTRKVTLLGLEYYVKCGQHPHRGSRHYTIQLTPTLN